MYNAFKSEKYIRCSIQELSNHNTETSYQVLYIKTNQIVPKIRQILYESNFTNSYTVYNF